MNRKLYQLLPLLSVCTGLLVFWPGLQGGFIFDDLANLVHDPDWKLTTLNSDTLRRAAFNGFAGAGGRPLALLSFALNHYFAGMDPFALKLTNLAFHLFNGLLVLALCTRLFSLVPSSNDERERMGRFAAWAVALAWMLHPLQASTVLYVVQRMEIGAATGILLALLAYLKARTAQIEGHHSAPWFAAAVLATGMGLGFKETALLTPGFCLLLELFVLHFRTRGGQRSRVLTRLYTIGAFAALALFFGWMLPHYLPPGAYALRDFTLGQRLLTQAPVLATYLGQILLPLPEHLLFYYDNYPVSTGLLSPPSTAVTLIALIALMVLAVLLRKRWPLFPLGIAWFFLAHALTSNVVALELAFEHRNYLALLGILIAAAQLLCWVCVRLHTDARRTLACLPVLVLATLCLIQVCTWSEPVQLATALASRNIDSPRASFELGRLLLERSGGDVSSPQWSFAHKEFEHAAALPRSSPLPEQALIIMDSRAGREIPANVWASFQRKLGERTMTPEGENALFSVLACRQKGLCRLDDKQLFQSFAVALQRNPYSAVVHSMYATFAFNIMNDRGLGIDVMRQAAALAPGDAQFKANLAQFLAVAGNESEELESLLAAIRSANGNGRYSQDLETIERLRRQAHPEGSRKP